MAKQLRNKLKNESRNLIFMAHGLIITNIPYLHRKSLISALSVIHRSILMDFGNSWKTGYLKKLKTGLFYW